MSVARKRTGAMGKVGRQRHLLVENKFNCLFYSERRLTGNSSFIVTSRSVSTSGDAFGAADNT
jgi:hypothetical protein